MQQNQLAELYRNSFDTYKVFDTLKVEAVGRSSLNAPKTIWQILNHLVIWQEHQILQLKGLEGNIGINEQESWIEEEHCESQEALDTTVLTFHNQLTRIKEEVSKIDPDDQRLHWKLKVIQDLSVHLSFHVGEVVLMRRIEGTYPMPDEMKEFLKER